MLNNFGAFFDEKFRINDILWGRLDGAERIITALLPNEEDEPKREELIEEATVQSSATRRYLARMPKCLAPPQAAIQEARLITTRWSASGDSTAVDTRRRAGQSRAHRAQCGPG